MNLTTSLPTASIAAAKVTNGEYDKAQKQLKSIEEQILTAINKGQRSTSVGSLEPAVKTKLESLGYKIQTGQQYNETWTSISW